MRKVPKFKHQKDKKKNSDNQIHKGGPFDPSGLFPVVILPQSAAEETRRESRWRRNGGSAPREQRGDGCGAVSLR